MHYVILGNGVCGMEAALALRRREAEARITLVSDEHDHFFSRPALMYIFAGQTTLRDTEPYDRELYPRMGFERVGKRVTALETSARALVFADGSRLVYDRLLLAVGSKARPAPWPGAAGPGLHYFVTLRDLQALDQEAKPGMRAAVVGGGLIGVEAAEVLHDRGLDVTFVIRENWYFPLALDANEAALVAEHMRAHGIHVRLGVGVEEVRRGGDGRLRGLKVAGEELPCDVVLSACANVTWADGSRRPEQLWYTARDQGRLAARSLLGDEAAYRRGTWYNSAKFFDLEYTTAGWVPVLLNWDNTPLDPGPDIRYWYRRLPGRYESQRVVLKGERVIGFNMLGSRWNHEPLMRWIEERRGLDYVLGHLAEAQFDEEFSPRFSPEGGEQRT